MKSKLLYGMLTTLILSVIIVSAIMFFDALKYDMSCNWGVNNQDHVELSGEYSEEGGPWKPLTRNTKFDYIELRDITVRGSFTKDIPKGANLYLKIDQLRVAMKVNGKEIVRFQPERGDGNPTQAIGKLWYSVSSPGITTDDVVELNFGNLYKNAYLIQFDELLWHMRIGSESMFLEAMKEESGLWWMGISDLFITFFLLTVYIICAKLRFKGSLQFLWLCLTAFFSGMWFCTLAPSLSLIWARPVFFDILYAYSIQGIAIFVTLFVAYNVTEARKQALLACSCVVMLLLIVDMIRQIAGVQDLFSAINHFSILDIGVALCILICLGLEIRLGNNKVHLKNLLNAMLPLVLFGILELINGYIQFSEAGICFGLGLISFLVMQSYYILKKIKDNVDSEKKALILENALKENSISIMLSQIQPHFIYNSLVVIMELCDHDPEEAKNTVAEFSHYLRGNLDSLTLNVPIPFEKELKHVKSYLALEQKRFGHCIQVSYDIKTRDFLIPALTVQPLVENAVRYGISSKEFDGKIDITTEETEDNVVIIISDNGIGFDADDSYDDGRSHVGVENVRGRLEGMCNGSLSIESVQDQGTRVTIIIPKGGEQ